MLTNNCCLRHLLTNLYSDVEARDVEGLKHNLSRVLSVLWCVEWRLREEEEVVLWLCSEVLEDTLLPEPLHQVPVLHDAMSDGVLGSIAWNVSLVSNVEVCVCVCVCVRGV